MAKVVAGDSSLRSTKDSRHQMPQMRIDKGTLWLGRCELGIPSDLSIRPAIGGKPYRGTIMHKYSVPQHVMERVLVDPEVDASRTGVPHAINYFMPAWDGRHVAYGISAGGSEDASSCILDVKIGKLVGEPIPRVHETLLNWLPDGKSPTFNQLKVLKPGDPESETYLDSVVMWLKVGDPASGAKAVFGPTVTRDLGLVRLDAGQILFTPGSPWMIARTTDTTVPEGNLFVARVADLGSPDVEWKRISRFEDKITGVALRGNGLYLLTHANAPRKRVLKLELRKPDLKLAREVATAPKDGVVQGFSLTRDALIATVREGMSVVLRRYAPGDGDTLGTRIPLPFKRGRCIAW